MYHDSFLFIERGVKLTSELLMLSGILFLGALTGSVYELTIGDAQAAAMSGKIRGQIWLTDPYEVDASPFITVPISRDLSNQIATQRVQIM